MADLGDPRYWRPWRGTIRVSQCGRWTISARVDGSYQLRGPDWRLAWEGAKPEDAMRVAELEERAS